MAADAVDAGSLYVEGPLEGWTRHEWIPPLGVDERSEDSCQTQAVGVGVFRATRAERTTPYRRR